MILDLMDTPELFGEDREQKERRLMDSESET
jgi:hypothetical protein